MSSLEYELSNVHCERQFTWTQNANIRSTHSVAAFWIIEASYKGDFASSIQVDQHMVFIGMLNLAKMLECGGVLGWQEQPSGAVLGVPGCIQGL